MPQLDTQGPNRKARCFANHPCFEEAEPILVLTRRVGTGFVLTRDHLDSCTCGTCGTCVPTCDTFIACIPVLGRRKRLRLFTEIPKNAVYSVCKRLQTFANVCKNVSEFVCNRFVCRFVCIDLTDTSQSSIVNELFANDCLQSFANVCANLGRHLVGTGSRERNTYTNTTVV